MKGLTAVAIFLALTVAAVAKPAPVRDLNPADDRIPTARNDVDINIGPTGAMLERNYFQAPQRQFGAGSFSCRMQLSVFDKTRLAQSCN